MIEQIEIRHELRPGDLGTVTALHGEIYAREHGYNHIFEAYVAESLAEFGKQFDPTRDRLWIAERQGRILGSVGILSRENGQCQLRWLLVTPDARGVRLGATLLDSCIEFARSAGYRGIYLWTVHTLAAAARLYERAGFELVETTPLFAIWGPELAEQRYELSFDDPN